MGSLLASLAESGAGAGGLGSAIGNLLGGGPVASAFGNFLGQSILPGGSTQTQTSQPDVPQSLVPAQTTYSPINADPTKYYAGSASGTSNPYNSYLLGR